MASPLILTLLAKHHLVERDPIGSPDFFAPWRPTGCWLWLGLCEKIPPPPVFLVQPVEVFHKTFLFLGLLSHVDLARTWGFWTEHERMWRNQKWFTLQYQNDLHTEFIFVSLSLCLSESCFNQVLAEAHCVSRLGHFRITFGLIFKASPVVHPFIWLRDFTHMQIKLILISYAWLSTGLVLKKRQKKFRTVCWVIMLEYFSKLSIVQKPRLTLKILKEKSGFFNLFLPQYNLHKIE